jgi:hypothetical protein
MSALFMSDWNIFINSKYTSSENDVTVMNRVAKKLITTVKRVV